MPKLNRYAFTATPQNSYKFTTMNSTLQIGDPFLHSIHGFGLIVRIVGRQLTVRTDITLDQLIEAL